MHVSIMHLRLLEEYKELTKAFWDDSEQCMVET
jgi:hypothetical protein